eukprot:46796_1
MAEQKYNNIIKNDAAKNKEVCLLIRGCTNPPKDVKVSKKKGTKNGNYLKGMTIDMMNMEQWCNENFHFYNAISNNNMTAATVLKEISNACKYAKLNKALGLRIYYTGHGETGTGNWLFKDKALSLNSIINAIKTHWGSKHLVLYCDCCYGGNWCYELKKYKYEVSDVNIKAACWPNQCAYDDPENGGYWTQFMTDKKDLEELKNLYRCCGYVHLYGNQLEITYYKPNGEIEKRLFI